MGEKLEEKPKKSLQLLDFLLGKFISRKLLVFVAATMLMLWSDLASGDWTTIAIFYIATQGVVDVALALKHGKTSQLLQSAVEERYDELTKDDETDKINNDSAIDDPENNTI